MLSNVALGRIFLLAPAINRHNLTERPQNSRGVFLSTRVRTKFLCADHCCCFSRPANHSRPRQTSSPRTEDLSIAIGPRQEKPDNSGFATKAVARKAQSSVGPTLKANNNA